MPIQSFTLILQGLDDVRDEKADALAAQCDDALMSRSGPVVSLDFDREAPTLREAIASAIRDVERAHVGARVVRIEEAPPDPSVTSLNGALQLSAALEIDPESRPLVYEILQHVR
jgi:hypothetical protein